MMRIRLLPTLVVLLALVVPPRAVAQDTRAERPSGAWEQPRKHEGFWISFGFGGGWALEDNYFGGSRGGFASHLRMGGTPRSNVLVGGELIGWTASEGATDVSRGNAMLSVFFYPSVSTGVYIRGGVGVAGRSAQTKVDVGSATATLSRSEGGFGMAGGVGWDIRLARNFYLTPAADLILQTGMDDQAALLLFTVGATWH